MYPIPPNETLVEERTCKHCSVKFPITDKDMEFYEKVSPSFHGKKYTIPAPTLCPDCRQKRRLSFRNERKLYKKKCDATGKDIISIYSPDKPYTVYHQDYWWSDKWNPLDYGREFNFSRSAMEQMGELLREVPKIALFCDPKNENCHFTNASGKSKDCYLVFDIDNCQDCFYGVSIKNSASVFDSLFINNCQNCYSLTDCSYCTDIYFGWGCNYSANSSYIVDTENVHHCFLSHTIYNKSYIFENIQYSKEEYEILVKDFHGLSSKEKADKIEKWINSYTTKKPYPYHLSVSFTESIGSGLSNTKNVYSSYDLIDSEYCRYSTGLINANNTYDTDSFGDNISWLLEIGDSGHDIHRSMFSDSIAFGCTYIQYSRYCFHSSHLFLCSGLRNASYCILNKQYTKDEYEVLVPKIIEHMMKTGEWGEFFPSSLSPFGYNETVAQEYFPLTQSEATKDGIFNWSDYEPPFPQVAKIIPAHKLPENIEDIPDDILNWAIECEVTKKPFRIIKQELEFYRKHSLPIPRRHPDQRHLDRMAQRNPRKLYERKCDKCGKNMITTYSPDRPEIVYCEVCYEREVVG